MREIKPNIEKDIYFDYGSPGALDIEILIDNNILGMVRYIFLDDKRSKGELEALCSSTLFPELTTLTVRDKRTKATLFQKRIQLDEVFTTNSFLGSNYTKSIYKFSF